jgi:hypothetical protein
MHRQIFVFEALLTATQAKLVEACSDRKAVKRTIAEPWIGLSAASP